jgi:hypothetical protein
VNTPASNSQRVITGHFGVLALTLRRAGYAWRVVDEQGRTLGAGHGACR